LAAKVYFSSLKATKRKENHVSKLANLAKAGGLWDKFKEKELIAIKIHFGEQGNTGFINPIYTREIIARLKEKGCKPFLTDTNTLYVGTRANSVDHLETALAHGFGYATTGAPLIIADGLTGKNYIEVGIKGEHLSSVRIAGDIYSADGLVTMSHFKGHVLTSFGGAIKNLGMGLGSRSGKYKMHQGAIPNIDEEACIKCGECVEWCPADAIIITPQESRIDPDLCIGCGECKVTCNYEAVKVSGGTTNTRAVQEKMVEYALGGIKGKEKKMGYFNFLMDITPECDCCGWSDRPIVPDQGFLYSDDPVAIDQASLDLVNKARGFEDSALKENHEPGQDKFRGVHPDVDPEDQLQHAEKIGLGSRKHELINID